MSYRCSKHGPIAAPLCADCANEGTSPRALVTGDPPPIGLRKGLRPIPHGGPVNKAIMGLGDQAALLELRKLLAHFQKPDGLHEDLNALRNVLNKERAPVETLAVLVGLQCNTLDDVDRFTRLVRAGYVFFAKEPNPGKEPNQ